MSSTKVHKNKSTIFNDRDSLASLGLQYFLSPNLAIFALMHLNFKNNDWLVPAKPRVSKTNKMLANGNVTKLVTLFGSILYLQ